MLRGRRAEREVVQRLLAQAWAGRSGGLAAAAVFMYPKHAHVP
ncbi:hypothetical protein [Nonomuraea sp. NPDC049784]